MLFSSSHGITLGVAMSEQGASRVLVGKLGSLPLTLLLMLVASLQEVTSGGELSRSGDKLGLLPLIILSVLIASSQGVILDGELSRSGDILGLLPLFTLLVLIASSQVVILDGTSGKLCGER